MTGSEIERSRGHPPLEIDENNNKKNTATSLGLSLAHALSKEIGI
jgi:hypothetical protein